MILNHLKIEENITTGIQNICSMNKINITILRAEGITTASVLRADDIITSKKSIVHLISQKQYSNKQAMIQKQSAEGSLKETT